MTNYDLIGYCNHGMKCVQKEDDNRLMEYSLVDYW